jgi:hypothetical protein
MALMVAYVFSSLTTWEFDLRERGTAEHSTKGVAMSSCGLSPTEFESQAAFRSVI